MKKIKLFVQIVSCVFLIACTSEENKWILVKQLNTIDSYKEFMNDYPQSVKSDSAMLFIEKKIWENCCDSNEIQIYQNFQKKFPKSKFFKKAQTKIEILETRKIVENLDVDLLKDWIIKHPESELKSTMDSLVKRKLIPAEYWMDFSLNIYSESHPTGNVFKLKLNDVDIVIENSELKNGLLKTKQLGKIEFYCNRMIYFGEQNISLYASVMQINKLNELVKNSKKANKKKPN